MRFTLHRNPHRVGYYWGLLRDRSRIYKPNGKQERARRLRQMQSGVLNTANRGEGE